MLRLFTLFVLSTLSYFTVFPLQYALALPPANQGAADDQTITGTVAETMNAAGYTYLLISTGNVESWIAIPETQVEKGSTVHYYPGMIMRNFASKTLNRTFETITFSPGLAESGAIPEKSAENDSFAAAIAKEKAGVSNPVAPVPQASGGSTGAVVPFTDISLEKATAPNGYNIEEIFNKANELNGKNIQVRGQVVKFSPMIMGKNWVHVQDGSGDPMKNTHDLVITTNESAEVGQVIVFEGLIAAQKDFGAGYKYDVIVEQATIIK